MTAVRTDAGCRAIGEKEDENNDDGGEEEMMTMMVMTVIHSTKLTVTVQKIIVYIVTV